MDFANMAPATRPNLIKELVVERPNQLVVADITYWFTQFGCLYISLVTDDYRTCDPVQTDYGLLCGSSPGCGSW